MPRAKIQKRKPTKLKNKIYPLVEVYDGRIWMQVTPGGKWIKVPKSRALYIADRLQRAALHCIKRSA